MKIFLEKCSLQEIIEYLPDDIYELLVYYYNDAYYDLKFVTIAGASDKLILEEESEDFIVVLRIRIGSKIFGTNIAPISKEFIHIGKVYTR